jgi:cyclophilin family peptidyl-prolyl cis-trans isomerase
MTISEMTLRIQRGPRASLVMSIVNRLASATTWAAALFLALMIGSVQSAEPPTTKYKYDTLIQQGKSQLDGSAEQAAAAGKAAIKMSPERWEGYALVGGALMNLKRYEEAADTLSKAIERAPQSKQPTLRDLRRQCLLAESGSAAVANTPALVSTTSQAEIVLWKSIEYSTNSEDFSTYLAQYPQGAFAGLAQRHLKATTKAQVQVLTSTGAFTIELDAGSSPLTVSQFLKYVDQGQYAGTIIHRVVANFVIQGGGFDTQYRLVSAPLKVINESHNGLLNKRGTVALARRPSDPNGGDRQFYVNLVDNAALDPSSDRPWGYAVFGRVVKGMDVVDRIGNAPTGARGPLKQDTPLDQVVIENIGRVNTP